MAEAPQADGRRDERAARAWPLAYLALASLVGVLLLFFEVPDHGRTLDDGVQRRRGEAMLEYLATLDSSKLPAGNGAGPVRAADFSKGDRLYGPLGVTPALALGRLIAPWIGDPTAARHLEFHAGLALWFVLLFGCTLALGRRWTGSGVGGLVAGCLLLAQPRLLGLATVSPSDLPAAATFALSVLLLWRWLERPTWTRAVPLAAAIGAVLAVRAQNGVVLLPVIAAFLVPRCLPRGARGRPPLPAVQLLAAPFLCYAFWVLAWPDFWSRPWTGPLEVLRSFASLKDERYAIEVFWFGESVLGPPEYSFVMLAVTTPLVVLGAAALGLVRSFRRPALAVGLAVWFFLSTGKHLSGYGNHGGIRHFLDAYVPLTLWAAAGAIWLGERVAGRRGAPLALAAAVLLLPGARSLHPFESSYYNRLVGGVAGAEGRLNLDPDGTAMLPLMQALAPRLAPGDVLLFLGNADLVTQVALPAGTIVFPMQPENVALITTPAARLQMSARRVWLVQPNHPTLFADAFERGTLERVVAVGPAGRTVALAARVADPAFFDDLARLARPARPASRAADGAR